MNDLNGFGSVPANSESEDIDSGSTGYDFWEMTEAGGRKTKENGRPWIDMNDGVIRNVGLDLELEPRKLPFRFIQALTRTPSVGPYDGCSQRDLFSALYPGEFFSLHSSPLRIHAVLGRIRAWARLYSLPIVILSRELRFLISPDTLLIFRVRENHVIRSSVSPLPLELRRAEMSLREVFQGRLQFKSSEVRDVLGVSLRTSVTRINALSSAGILHSAGKGRARYYWFSCRRPFQGDEERVGG